MPFDATFNARDYEPRQSGGKHQVGNKWQGVISNTSVTPTKDGGGGMFVVEFSSAGGTVQKRYNLWNESESARKFAQNELAALCYATGIFNIDFKNDGLVLRGAKLLYDVAFQAGQEPSAEKPEGGYVEAKKVYDLQGNDTWTTGGGNQQQTSGFGQQQNNNQQQQQFNNQPQTQQMQQNQQPQVQGGWNAGATQQQNQQQNNNTANNTGGWNQGSTQENPPWK